MTFIDSTHHIVDEEGIIEDLERIDDYELWDISLEDIEEEEERKGISNRVITRNPENDWDDPLAYYNEDYFE